MQDDWTVVLQQLGERVVVRGAGVDHDRLGPPELARQGELPLEQHPLCAA